MIEISTNERRLFLKKITSLGAIATLHPAILHAMAPGKSKGGDGYSFLFQGDSITDGNRSRNNDWNHVLGHGYQYIIASRLGFELPGKDFHFYNRGISGNKVPDLAARWETDTMELKPDLLSILIGINDVSAFISGDTTFTAERYHEGYNSLLQETKQRLPTLQLVLCEPFILPVGQVKDRWTAYSAEIEKRRVIVNQLAVEHNAVVVKFQNAFNQALSKAPAEYWIWDGIHPMPAGHELMAREWITQVGKKLKFILD